jgi:protein SCO1/2
MKLLLRINLIALVLVLGAIVWLRFGRTTAPDDHSASYAKLVGRIVPDFELTESRGTPVTLSTIKGRIWVANLMFATCNGVCLRLGEQMKSLDSQLGPRDDIRLVSISVNPEADTPENLRKYAEGLKASAKWLFLTGSRSEITKLATGGFALSAGTAEVLTHSDKLVLIDREGVVRGYFDGEKPESIPQIVEAIARLNQPISTPKSFSQKPNQP